MMGMHNSKLSTNFAKAHNEQVVTRALHIFINSCTPHKTERDKFSKDECVYFFKRGPDFVKCEEGFVMDVDNHILSVAHTKQHKFKPIRATYEDVRKVPASQVLNSLEKNKLLLPRSQSTKPDIEDLDEFTNASGPPEIFSELNEDPSVARINHLLRASLCCLLLRVPSLRITQSSAKKSSGKISRH